MKTFFGSSDAVPAMAMLVHVASSFVARSPAFHHQTLATRSTSASTSSSSHYYMARRMDCQDYGSGIEADSMHKRQSPFLEDSFDPENEIYKYIPPPEPMVARQAGLDGTILVSGWANDSPTSSSPQAIFDLLNHEDSAFCFEHIVALVNDERNVKKHLFGRTARNTGVSRKLSFAQSDGSAGDMPTL
jgi:hypothetical protein